MIGKVIDMDKTDAFVALMDGNTMDISLSRLPQDIKIGQEVDIPDGNIKAANDKLIDFF